MQDTKDILGVRKDAEKGEGHAPAEKPAKPKPAKMKRPEGMSREAFALLGDSHPIVSAHELLPKKKDVKPAKPKPSTKGIVTWGYKPFRSSARTDGLELMRWTKGYKDAAGRLKEPDETDYYFAKFNKKVQVWKYDDEEYETLIRPVSGDWSREETDYLLDMCERFDLRFIVIADKYEFVPPSPSIPQPPPRTLEDLKARYYTIARRLLIAREGGEAPVANDVLVKHPYNKEHDQERKKGIEMMQRRSRAELDLEYAIIAEARQVEEDRRVEAEAAAAAAAQAAAAAAAAAAGPAPGVTGTPGAGPQGFGPGRLPGPVTSAQDCLRFPVSFPADPGPRVPSLLSADLQPIKPPPGVYARGVHAINVANTAMAALPGGQKAQKLAEQTLLELGWPGVISGPRVASRPVCAAWLALRAEVNAFVDMKRTMAGRYGDSEKKKRRR